MERIKTKNRENADETSGEITMDSLYIAWSEDRQSAAPKPLRQWIAQHPRHSDALTAWTADAPLLDLADAAPTDVDGERRACEIGLNLVAEMRAQYFAASAPPVSLTAAAKNRGLTLAAFAQTIGVGLTVASKLNRRLIHAGTIPMDFVQRMADALDLTAAQIRAYLQQAPTLAQGAMYRADAAPQVQIADKQNFAEAIASAPDMDDTEKALWQSETL